MASFICRIHSYFIAEGLGNRIRPICSQPHFTKYQIFNKKKEVITFTAMPTLKLLNKYYVQKILCPDFTICFICMTYYFQPQTMTCGSFIRELIGRVTISFYLKKVPRLHMTCSTIMPNFICLCDMSRN